MFHIYNFYLREGPPPQKKKKKKKKKNTIKAGGSTARAQSKMSEWVSGVDGYPLDCYDY